jgi:glutathione S-transferase
MVTPVRLYDLKAGTNPRRVRIFLAEKGLVLPVVPVDMRAGENSTPEFLAKNPLGRLPVLELSDGTYLAESLAICRFIEALHPTPPLFGVGALDQARVEMWTRRMEIELLQPIGDGFVHASPLFAGRRPQYPDYGRSRQAGAREIMAWLDRELAGRPFIAGETYTVADITAQCALLLGKNTGAPMPEGLHHLQQWWSQVTARPSARA